MHIEYDEKSYSRIYGKGDLLNCYSVKNCQGYILIP